MSNTNNVMNEGLPSNVICSDPYGCTFEEIVELLGEKVEELSLGLFIKRNPKFKIKQLRLIVLKTVAIQKNTLLSLTMDIV